MKRRFGGAVAAGILLLGMGGLAEPQVGLASAPPARTDDSIVIKSIELSENPVHMGDSVTTTVLTTINVASVTAQAGTFRISIPKVAAGRFRATIQVPRLWWFWSGNITVTAIRTDGASVHRDVPVQVRF